MKDRVEAARVPVPVLSPRSTAPITLRFTEVGLEKVFESLGKVAGVNILFDEGFRDKKATVNLTSVSFEEALDRISFVNRLFYKVLDQNTVIVVPDSAANRRKYEEVLVRTFYIQNAELKEVETIVKTVVGPTAKVGSNPTLGALSIIGTLDELALAQRIVDSHDKARGEVLVELEILEVNRTRLKQWGIELSNYSAGVTFSPTGRGGRGRRRLHQRPRPPAVLAEPGGLRGADPVHAPRAVPADGRQRPHPGLAPAAGGGREEDHAAHRDRGPGAGDDLPDHRLRARPGLHARHLVPVPQRRREPGADAQGPRQRRDHAGDGGGVQLAGPDRGPGRARSCPPSSPGT